MLAGVKHSSLLWNSFKGNEEKVLNIGPQQKVSSPKLPFFVEKNVINLLLRYSA
jgi:hypothetical protein